jgi:hypothetical protein
MRYFCPGHDILGVQKSLRVELGGGLPLFTSIREVEFSETGVPVYGVLENRVFASPQFSETHMRPALYDRAERLLRRERLPSPGQRRPE